MPTNDKFNIMATIRRLEIAESDQDGQPIYRPKLYDQPYFEQCQ